MTLILVAYWRDQDISDVRPGERVLEAVKKEYNLMPNGETGDDSITDIPFQVLYSLILNFSFFFFFC